MELAKKIGAMMVALSVLSACAPPGQVVGDTSQSSQSSSGVQEPAPGEVVKPPKSIPEPRASKADNQKVCASGSTVPGLDVSHYDPNTDWTKIAKNGAKFAFIKATEGVTNTNAFFPGDWVATKAKGIRRGAYHFFRPKTDPVEQANFFIKTLGKIEPDALPAVLDWEDSDGVSVKVQIQKAKTWLTLVEAATGQVPIIYTGPSYWNSLGNPQDFIRYPLFIAHYGTTCPLVPPPWSIWDFWQYDTAPLAGVNATLADVDHFNGTEADLEVY